MKVRELIERLQQMEQDATVTVRICEKGFMYRGRIVKTDEVRIDRVNQNGAGMNSTAILEPEDELSLYGGVR